MKKATGPSPPLRLQLAIKYERSKGKECAEEDDDTPAEGQLLPQEHLEEAGAERQKKDAVCHPYSGDRFPIRIFGSQVPYSLGSLFARFPVPYSGARFPIGGTGSLSATLEIARSSCPLIQQGDIIR